VTAGASQRESRGERFEAASWNNWRVQTLQSDGANLADERINETMKRNIEPSLFVITT